MIKLDISKSTITEKELSKIEIKIKEINSVIKSRKGEGAAFTDWLSWPVDHYAAEMTGMVKKAKELRKELKVEKLLVIGIGGSYLGAQSGLDFVKGTLRSKRTVLFSGINMSSSHYVQLEEELENTNWAIAVISKSGTTLEPALAFRHFKNILTKKVGKKEVSKYIVAITDKEKGALKTLANQEGYTTFTIPDGIGGRFSGITPVGLFPMAFAEIDINKLMDGAKEAMEMFENQEGLDNLAYKYAATRYLLNKGRKWRKNGYDLEVFTSYDPDLMFTGEWFKQLFGESEGKDGKGIYPSSAVYSADLHSLGQYIQEGKKGLMFETTLWVENDNNSIKIAEDDKNLDNLNYLSGQNLHKINERAMRAVVDAHDQGGNPQIIIEINDKTEKTLGKLWYFYFMAVTMSGYLLEVNPFNQPGVELYKKLMFKNLGKPE